MALTGQSIERQEELKRRIHDGEKLYWNGRLLTNAIAIEGNKIRFCFAHDEIGTPENIAEVYANENVYDTRHQLPSDRSTGVSAWKAAIINERIQDGEEQTFKGRNILRAEGLDTYQIRLYLEGEPSFEDIYAGITV